MCVRQCVISRSCSIRFKKYIMELLYTATRKTLTAILYYHTPYDSTLFRRRKGIWKFLAQWLDFDRLMHIIRAYLLNRIHWKTPSPQACLLLFSISTRATSPRIIILLTLFAPDTSVIVPALSYTNKLSGRITIQLQCLSRRLGE